MSVVVESAVAEQASQTTRKPPAPACSGSSVRSPVVSSGSAASPGGAATRLSAVERIGRTPPRGKRFSPLVGLPQDDDRVAAGTVLIIAEGTVGGWPEFQAIAGSQPVRDLPLYKNEASGQHPDKLTDKGISRGGEGDRGTRRQLDLDKIERKVRPGSRGDQAANISRGGVRPSQLVVGPDEPPGTGRLGPGEQCR